MQRIDRFSYNTDNKNVEIGNTGVFTADNNKQGRQVAAHLNRSLSEYMREWKTTHTTTGGPRLIKGKGKNLKGRRTTGRSTRRKVA